MKYFSLSEVLVGVPASLLLGALFACIYTFLSAFFSGLAEFFRCIKSKWPSNLKIKSNRTLKKKKSEVGRKVFIKTRSSDKRTAAAFQLITEEVFNFFTVIFFSLIFAVFLYIVSDGVLRGYIIILTLASFFGTSRLLERPLGLICAFLSRCFSEIFLIILFIFTYIPVKIYKKSKNYKIIRKK